MDIRNTTQFSSFLSANGLTGLDSVFGQLVTCMGDFNRTCDCHGRANKNAIYVRCCGLYVHGAQLAASTYRNQFLSKTSETQISFFADNGELIARANR